MMILKEFSRIVCVSLFSYQGSLFCCISDSLFTLSYLLLFVNTEFLIFSNFSIFLYLTIILFYNKLYSKRIIFFSWLLLSLNIITVLAHGARMHSLLLLLELRQTLYTEGHILYLLGPISENKADLKLLHPP